jgi:hypothetical protein
MPENVKLTVVDDDHWPVPTNKMHKETYDLQDEMKSLKDYKYECKTYKIQTGSSTLNS